MRMAKMSEEEYSKARQEFESQRDISFENLKSIAFSPSNAEQLADKVMSSMGLKRDRHNRNGEIRYHSHGSNGAVSVKLSGDYCGSYYDFRNGSSGSVFKEYFEQQGLESLEGILSLVPVETAKEHYEKFIAPLSFDKWLNEEKGFVTHALYQLQQGNAPAVQSNHLQIRWETALSVSPEEIAKRNAMYAKAQDFQMVYQEQPIIPFTMNKVIPEKQIETFAYLTQIRGLDMDMVQDLMKKDKIMTYFYQGENQDGNTYLKEKKFGFPMQNSNGEIVGIDARPLYHETGKKSTVETGSPSKTSFVEFQCGKCDENAKVLLFEAAIDALSYMEMYARKLDNIRLISIQGANNIDGAVSAIEGYHVRPENIFVCTDNDKAGYATFRALQERYPIPDRNRLIPPDEKKDWNSYLCAVKGIDEGLKKTSDSYLAETYERWFSNQRNLFSEQQKFNFKKPIMNAEEPKEEKKEEAEEKEFPEYRVSSRTRERMPNNPNVQIPVNHMRQTAQMISEMMIDKHLETYSKFKGQVNPSFPNIYYQEHYRSGISLMDNGVKLQFEMTPQAIREGTIEFSGFSAYQFETRSNFAITENQQILLNAMADSGLLNESHVRDFLEKAVIIPSLDNNGNEKPVRKQFGKEELPETSSENIQKVLEKAAETRELYQKTIAAIQQTKTILEQMQNDPNYAEEVDYLYQDMQSLSEADEQIRPTAQQRLEMRAYHCLTESNGSFDTAIQKLDIRLKNGEMKLNDLNLQCKELQEEIDKTQIKHTVQQEHKNVS